MAVVMVMAVAMAMAMDIPTMAAMAAVLMAAVLGVVVMAAVLGVVVMAAVLGAVMAAVLGVVILVDMVIRQLPRPLRRLKANKRASEPAQGCVNVLLYATDLRGDLLLFI
jgi:UPF0716 family protein affecting phage T7 exclusion